MSQPSTLPPLVRAAVHALDTFGAVSAREARTLLGYWARRDQLSPDEVDQVLTQYPISARPADPTGFLHERDEVPTGEPVPDHVDGWHAGGREADR